MTEKSALIFYFKEYMYIFLILYANAYVYRIIIAFYWSVIILWSIFLAKRRDCFFEKMMEIKLSSVFQIVNDFIINETESSEAKWQYIHLKQFKWAYSINRDFHRTPLFKLVILFCNFQLLNKKSETLEFQLLKQERINWFQQW